MLTVDTILKWNGQDEFISTNMVPFAGDEGGDVYYYDVNTGNVVLYRADDIDNKILICTCLSDFIELF